MKNTNDFFRFVKAHRSEICTVLSATGVIATAVLSVRSGIKAERILQDSDLKNEPKKKTIKAVAPIFIPPTLTAAATIGCILYSDIKDRKMQAALIAAYSASVKTLRDYKEQAKIVCGEEAVEQIDHNIEKENYIFQLKETDLKSGASSDDEVLFYDEESKRFFWKTKEEVLSAEYELNRYFVGRGQASLNDWYRILEIDEVEYGIAVGWESYIGEINYGYKWIDFYHKLVESNDPDMPSYYKIGFVFPPHSDYMGDGVY